MTSGIWLADHCGVSGELLTLELEHTQPASKVFLWEGVWGGGKASHLTWVRILSSRGGLARVQINDMAAFAFADDAVFFWPRWNFALAPSAADGKIREPARWQKAAAVWCSEVLRFVAYLQGWLPLPEPRQS